MRRTAREVCFRCNGGFGGLGGTGLESGAGSGGVEGVALAAPEKYKIRCGAAGVDDAAGVIIGRVAVALGIPALGIGGINDAVRGAAAGLFLDVVVRGMPPSPPVMIFLPSGGMKGTGRWQWFYGNRQDMAIIIPGGEPCKLEGQAFD